MNRFASTTDSDRMTDTQFQTWERKMRRALAAQGLVLSKSRRRNVDAMDYGLYNVSTHEDVSLSSGYTLSARTMEEWARS